MAKTLQTLTVKDLIELLECEDPNARVIFSTDYGDHSHTEQALPLRGLVDIVTVTRSAYSNSGFQIAEPDDDLDYEPFLVLR